MAKKRNEFLDKYKWNVKDLYKNDDEALKEIEWLDKEIDKISNYQNHILDSSDTLLELLDLDENINQKLERVFIYGHINNDADTLNTNYQELFGKVRNLYSKYLMVSAYIVPELLKSDYQVIQKYIKENKKLEKYKRSLKHIFRNKEHILSSEVEEALSSFANLMSAPEDIIGSLQDSDFKFDNILVDGKSVELNESNFSIYLRSNDRNVRKQAFESIYKTYANFKTTISSIIKSEVDKNVANARLRKFKNSLEASLFENEIDESVYYNLIDTIHKNLKSLYKYWDLKKNILNVKELHLYDTYASLNESDNVKYTFEDAKELVLNCVKPLGEQYVKDITKAFDEGWIDSCNNEGKRGGAYCTACYLTHPYVLLSFEGILNDVSTLAHELGHAMHYYYAINNQNFEDYNYSIFVAEVASQVNEILLVRYLLEHSNSKEDKIRLIDDLLQKYKASIFRQTMFAEFELFIHNYTEDGNILTSETMCNKYYELNKLYFGDNVCVDEEIKYEWERIPHFYMNFYVYQYATAFAAAIYLANNIYDGNTLIRDKYLEFLKLGCTISPIDSLKVAGVDMTKSDVYDNAIKYMDYLIEEYSKLQGSVKDE